MIMKLKVTLRTQRLNMAAYSERHPAMNRRSRLLTFTVMACLPVAGLVMAAMPAASAASPAASAASPSASARAHAIAVVREFISHLKVGDHAVNHAVGSNRPAISGLTQVQSTNWSGYADDNTAGNTYSSVSASWTEPTGTCSSGTSLAVFWVGLDGFTSDSVEQDGTLIECEGRTAVYFTWWEMYPTNDIQVVGETLRPGDSITSSVTRSGSTYTLKVTDSSRSADSFTKTETCSTCANSSAEWIAEAPSGSGGVEPLTNFGTWTASGAAVTGNTGAGVISTFPDDELTMVDSSGNVKAQPGPLNAGGNGFSVTWKRST
jgi:hypothetical protein